MRILFLYVLLLFLWICTTHSFAQTSHNVTLLSNINISPTANDVWGYVDTGGIEYAIIGSVDSVHIYSLENPASPVLRKNIKGDNSTWRDIKSFGNYIYAIADNGSNDGLLIVDMSAAPNTITHTYWRPTLTVDGSTAPLNRCHNLFIDEDGYAYLSGCNVGSGGIIILDLFSTPGTPIHVGEADMRYSHDVYTKDSIMYTSDIFAGEFSVYDVSNRTSPVLLANQGTGRAFTHNAWVSDDGMTLFTTDERSNAYVEAYDISDLNNISMIDRFRPLETEGLDVIPHNVHVHNDYLVVSWYTDGVVIVDAQQPDNLIEVGHYDTWPGPHGGYYGDWGAYPFLPSGNLLVSDRTTGLYVLSPTYQRACYLRGTVRDSATLVPIAGANIDILSSELNKATSDNFGEYASGVATAGTFDVIISHPSYVSDTLTVSLVNDSTVVIDALLKEPSNCPNSIVVNDTVKANVDLFAKDWISLEVPVNSGASLGLFANDFVDLIPGAEIELGAELTIGNNGCN